MKSSLVVGMIKLEALLSRLSSSSGEPDKAGDGVLGVSEAKGMDLSLLREDEASTHEVGGSAHFWSTHNLTISHVEVACLTGQVDFSAAFRGRVSPSTNFLFSRRLDPAEYEYFLAGDLVAAGVQEAEAAALGDVVDHLPLVLLDLVHLHVAHEGEGLLRGQRGEGMRVMELLTSEYEYVLVIKGAHPEALSGMIHRGYLGPLVILEAVHLA